jgi:hypothetical protein
MSSRQLGKTIKPGKDVTAARKTVIFSLNFAGPAIGSLRRKWMMAVGVDDHITLGRNSRLDPANLL